MNGVNRLTLAEADKRPVEGSLRWATPARLATRLPVVADSALIGSPQR